MCVYMDLGGSPTHLSNQSVGAGAHVQILARFGESSITRGQLNVCPVAPVSGPSQAQTACTFLFLRQLRGRSSELRL